MIRISENPLLLSAAHDQKRTFFKNLKRMAAFLVQVTKASVQKKKTLKGKKCVTAQFLRPLPQGTRGQVCGRGHRHTRGLCHARHSHEHPGAPGRQARQPQCPQALVTLAGKATLRTRGPQPRSPSVRGWADTGSSCRFAG